MAFNSPKAPVGLRDVDGAMRERVTVRRRNAMSPLLPMLTRAYCCRRREHTEDTRVLGSDVSEQELFSSRHLDEISVACVEDRCHVLSYAEYCRWVVAENVILRQTNPPNACKDLRANVLLTFASSRFLQLCLPFTTADTR